jgi:hypothetical protein
VWWAWPHGRVVVELCRCGPPVGPYWAKLASRSRAKASWLGSARCSSELKYLARLGSPQAREPLRTEPSCFELEPARELRAIFPALGGWQGTNRCNLCGGSKFVCQFHQNKHQLMVSSRLIDYYALLSIIYQGLLFWQAWFCSYCFRSLDGTISNGMGLLAEEGLTGQ